MNPVSRRHVVASLAGIGTLRWMNQLPELSGAKTLLAADERARRMDRLIAYFSGIAPQLLRPAEGILQHPSLAITLPGKAYSTELWDWDTMWVTRGLLRLASIRKDDALRARVCEGAKGSLLNFLDHQSREGRLAIMLSVSAADPFGCLKPNRPAGANQAKPVFAQLALSVADAADDVCWLRPHFHKLLAFYDSWFRSNGSPSGLLVWGNDVAIGNDNDPTTFGRPSYSSANLLLNCLFLEELKAAAELAHRLRMEQQGTQLTGRASRLAEAIQSHCWEPRDSFFYTADVQCVDRRAELLTGFARGMDMTWNSLRLRVQAFTGFLPMWCKVATEEQAKALVQENYLKDERFRTRAGVRTLSNQEPMYSLAFSSNPSNWLGPVWIISNYFVWRALSNYGYREAAERLADATIVLLSDDLEKNGSLNEYYHPDTGAPLSHHGFVDWNLLVTEMM